MSANKPPSIEDWQKLAQEELRSKDNVTITKTSPDGLEIKRVYTQNDLSEQTINELPGFEPYTRGIRASMYSGRPWTIRQYAGFSTAKASNKFYKQNLKAGQKGLSVAFDLATHRGYDSDHERVIGDVGKAGVAIDTAEDMKTLFDGIPLDKMSVSMTMNGAVIPVLAMFIVAGQEQGVEIEHLSGTIQNDILKEFMVRNTFIYPPEPSMRIVADIIAFTSQHMPKFNSISISGYHMQEAGSTLAQELAFTLADGMEYVRAALSKGLDVEQFAPRLSFFFCIGMDFFSEIAKLRAARQMWSKIMTDFGAKTAKAKMLRTHCQTSGVSLTAQSAYNNIVRTTIEAMAATLGGTQSLHTNSFDEAIALPSEFSAGIARNTQLILQHETGISDVVDPLGGSYYIETLTQQMADKAWDMIQEIEDLGGMTKAVAQGLPKLKIEEAAAKRQTRIDQGQDVIVGVNKFIAEDEAPIEVREIDNTKVRKAQIQQLEKIKKTRNNKNVQHALNELEICAATNNGNLLEYAIQAARERATLGEISSAMERVFGRYKPTAQTISGVYNEAYKDDAEYITIQKKIDQFKTQFGHTPHILVAKMGQDGHDRGAKIIASAFADIGFKVSLSQMFETPDEVAQHAIELDVDVVGISTLTAGHKILVPELIQNLRDQKKSIKVVCGGVIPEQDYPFLRQTGVDEIFGPGSHVLDSANAILSLLFGTLRNR